MIIDKSKAIELLERAVAEKGAGYVDPGAVPDGEGTALGCQYERKGAPACIVGHVYHYAGASLEDLKTMDAADMDDYGSAINGFIMAEELDTLPVETTPEAAEVLAVAQGCQDAGGTWGAALKIAKAY